MVDVDQALGWLNEERGSAVSPTTQSQINEFYRPGLSQAERRSRVVVLLRTAATLTDPFEQAEVFTNCGVFFYRLMQYDESIRWLQQADDYYRYLEDKHRQSMTSWMLYLVMRAIGQYRRAFNQGRRARILLQDKARQYRQLQAPGTESWYQGREVDFIVRLISTPEDSFEWLFEFNGTRMSRSAMQIKDRAQENIERRMFDDADRDIKTLLEITGKSRESAQAAEALAFAGVAEWVMERQMNALYYFRSALTQYVPCPHEYALLTWMMGLAEWSFPDLRPKSMAKLESAIQKVEELRQEAVWKNETTRRDWYTVHFVAMRRVLTRLID